MLYKWLVELRAVGIAPLGWSEKVQDPIWMEILRNFTPEICSADFLKSEHHDTINALAELL